MGNLFSSDLGGFSSFGDLPLILCTDMVSHTALVELVDVLCY